MTPAGVCACIAMRTCIYILFTARLCTRFHSEKENFRNSKINLCNTTFSVNLKDVHVKSRVFLKILQDLPLTKIILNEGVKC